ncbi:MAG TPA: hypothetical protein VEC36_10785, partial [Patescibacteria group bacterium]|nr:hypothetical protein [Patescibacteria group bacterium]
MQAGKIVLKIALVKNLIPSLFAAFLMIGCASVSAPSGWLESPQRAVKTGFGGWADVLSRNDTTYRGELIAVTYDSIYILQNERRSKKDGTVTPSRLRIFVKSEVREVMVTMYDAEEGYYMGATTAGILSTLTHGFYSIVTANLWAFGGSVATILRSYEPVFEYPGERWEEMAQYARFPQGIPEGIGQ